MHILLSAYACQPNAGTEAGNGWGWATGLAARGMRVHVLTVGSKQAEVEAELRREPRANLTVSFVEPARDGMKEGHGPHYMAWQFAAWKAAQVLHAREPFDLAHHVTYGSIHAPTQLWRLGIPTIFGPVGGGQTAPEAMLSYFGESRKKEVLRTLFTRFLPYSPLHRHWMRQMTVIYAGNDETQRLAVRLGGKNVVLAMDTGLPETFYSEGPRTFLEREGPLRLLWAGRMMPRKALALTLDGVARAKAEVRLTVLGEGYPAEVFWAMVRERGLEGKVDWSGGRVPWEEVRRAYASHDAFLFTSLRDSCGSQLLEAMALGLPIITLDHQGAHSLVPEGAGFKVPVTTKEATVDAIAAAVDAMAASSLGSRNAMSAAAWTVAHELEWTKRTARTESVYRIVLAARQKAKDRTHTADALRVEGVPAI